MNVYQMDMYNFTAEYSGSMSFLRAIECPMRRQCLLVSHREYISLSVALYIYPNSSS
jgi:hypothetical protein